jgi:hypothetical protein
MALLNTNLDPTEKESERKRKEERKKERKNVCV